MIASITWYKMHSVFSQAYNSDCSVTGPINQFISVHFTRPAVGFGSWSKMCEHRSVLYCTLTENKIMFYGVTVRSAKGISYFKQDSRFYPVLFSDQLSTVIYLLVAYATSLLPAWVIFISSHNKSSDFASGVGNYNRQQNYWGILLN